MSEIKYPHRQNLETWVQLLRRKNTLRLSLPVIDENWYEHVESSIERVRNSYSDKTLYRRGAEMFYNIIKSHGLINGNKRTGVVVTYLFFVLNERVIMKRADMYTLAKKVAMSRGRKNHDEWMKKIESFFESCTESIWDR